MNKNAKKNDRAHSNALENIRRLSQNQITTETLIFDLNRSFLLARSTYSLRDQNFRSQSRNERGDILGKIFEQDFAEI